MIQKDTNAGVRDASVALLTTFKAYLYESSLVNEAIQSLPKYRISEINKDAAEKLKTVQPATNVSDLPHSSSQKNVSRPMTANSNDVFVVLKQILSTPISSQNPSLLSQQLDEAVEKLG